MNGELQCLPNPCSTCPYRRDTPPGVWAREEYEKLPAFDEQWTVSTFLCHNGAKPNNTVCRGWLEVHDQNIGVRMASFKIVWTAANKRPTSVPLYASGKQARDFGLRGIGKPSTKARAAIAKLVARKPKAETPPRQQGSE